MNLFKKRNENAGFDDEDFYDGDYYKETYEDYYTRDKFYISNVIVKSINERKKKQKINI